ncbi:putative copia-like retrotransposon Hopscotch polyprotein [Tanacetum coccineum]
MAFGRPTAVDVGGNPSASTDDASTTTPSPSGVITRGHVGKVFPHKFIDGTVPYDSNRRAFMQHPDGSIDKYKAHLVTRGFTQQYGVDYLDTFSSVVKPTTVRVILSLTVSRRWHLCKIDVSNAFIHGFINEEVYMQQPAGFADS